MNILCGFIVVGYLVTLSNQATPVKPCNDGALPKEVRIDGCNKLPCKLFRGINATAEWDFVVKSNTRSLKPRVRATAFGKTFNYSFPQKDGCQALKNSTCPLVAGKEVTYQLNIPVLKNYRKLSFTIEFALLGNNAETLVCFKLPVRVSDR